MGIGYYVLIGVLLVGMIVMMVVQGRKQKKAQDDYMAMLDTLRPGVKVKMASGLLGRVKEIREEAPGFKTIVLAMSDDKNAPTMTFVIEAVQGIVNEEAIQRMNLERAAAVQQNDSVTVTETNEPATKINGEPVAGATDTPKKKSKSRK